MMHSSKFMGILKILGLGAIFHLRAGTHHLDSHDVLEEFQ